MTGEEFAEHLQGWKRELIDEVIYYYQAGNRDRGRLAFQRWKERLASFLREHSPTEADRFDLTTTHFAWVIKPRETPYETFMREDGNTCLAFIDDLLDSALKGRVTFAQNVRRKKRRSKKPPILFLSYAREDISSARRLFNNLEDADIDVWFDKESLLPGQKWKTAIKAAIRDSRFF